MKRSSKVLWITGWAGLGLGALLTIAGMASDHVLTNMFGGYGLMVMGAALYLLAGLGLRESLANRTRSSAKPAPISRAASGSQRP